MGSLVDYDIHYAKGPGQCGEPFAEIAQFFERSGCPANSRVLDLGCGQGRDALMAARLGHRVLGVDLSEIGLAQLEKEALAEGLDVEVACADVVHFRSRRRFDVVILDRVLHLLLSDEERLAALNSARRLTRAGGVVLIADGPKHSPLIVEFFATQPSWAVLKKTKRFLFARKPGGRAAKA